MKLATRKDPLIKRVKDAIQNAIAELSGLRDRLLKQGIDDSGGILDAHLLMMQDPLLFDEMQKEILENHAAEWALQVAVKKIQDLFQQMDDPYLKGEGKTSVL